jgi:signal transduction histidine kinase/CheY-like chemotaxis protein
MERVGPDVTNRAEWRQDVTSDTAICYLNGIPLNVGSRVQLALSDGRWLVGKVQRFHALTKEITVEVALATAQSIVFVVPPSASMCRVSHGAETSNSEPNSSDTSLTTLSPNKGELSEPFPPTGLRDINWMVDLLPNVLGEVFSGFIWLNQVGKIIECSSNFAQWIGNTKTAIIGSLFTSWLPVSERVSFAQCLIDLADKLEAKTIPILLEKVPASPRKFDLFILPIQMQPDRGYLVCIRDNDSFSGLKDGEAQSVVQTPTTNQTKSEFLATISNEIGTPLHALICMTELLMESGLNSHQKRYAGIIQSSSQTLLNLVNNILELSKIEARSLKLNPSTITIRTSMESALASVASHAKEKGIELGYIIGEGVPQHTDVDECRLNQILINLLTNAVKFTNQGSVWLGVRLFANISPEHDEDHLEWLIQDTGNGIAIEKQDLIFEAFQQVESIPNREGSGAGLGLTICRELIRQMGGDIWVTSSLGAGSTFYFTTKSNKPNVPIPSKKDLVPVISHALLIHREGVTQRSLVWMLNEMGVRVSVVESMQQAQPELRPDVGLLVLEVGQNMAKFEQELVELKRHIPLDQPWPPTLVIRNGNEDSQSLDRIWWERHIQSRLTFVEKPIKFEALRTGLRKIFEGSIISKGSSIPPSSRRNLIPNDLSILVAEDNVLNQQVILAMLEKFGLQADVVENGRAAVQALKRHPYQLILMDLRMPEMDGLQATRYIRTTFPKNRQPKIVVVTASVFAHDLHQAMQMGVDHFLLKPIQLDDLQSVLKPSSILPPTIPVESEGIPASIDKQTLDIIRSLQSIQNGLLLTKTIDLFLNSGRTQIATMQTAINQQQANTLQFAAHKLSGSASAMGFLKLAKMCGEIEQLSPRSNWLRLGILVESAHLLTEEACVFLQQIRNNRN